MASRPILKTNTDNETWGSPFPFAASSRIVDTPRVHFPPTPRLAATGTTHSPRIYDRAPIDVSPNACALPGRGERNFIPIDIPTRCRELRMNHQARDTSQGRNERYLHPRAYEAIDQDADFCYTRDTLSPPPFSLDPELDPYASSPSDSSFHGRRSPMLSVGLSISPSSVSMLSISPLSPGPSSLSRSFNFIPDRSYPSLPHDFSQEDEGLKDTSKRIKSKKSRNLYRTTHLSTSCSTSGFYEPVDGCLGGF